MAPPITPARWKQLVTAARIPVIWHEGWQTRNRGDRGDGWGPVHGVLLHHTVTRTLAGTLDLVRDEGAPGIPPPLYAGVVDREGILHQIGWGRCNHAGSGDGDVLRAVIAERSAPAPDEANTDGNAHFYGFAGINLGDMRDPWPDAQLRTLARVGAEVCREHGWTRNSVIGHRQWQRGKVDPRGPGEPDLMPRLRTMVHELL